MGCHGVVLLFTALQWFQSSEHKSIYNTEGTLFVLSRKHPPQVLKKTKNVSRGKPRCSWPHDLITGRLRLKFRKRSGKKPL